jgi:hypothetical protein
MSTPTTQKPAVAHTGARVILKSRTTALRTEEGDPHVVPKFQQTWMKYFVDSANVYGTSIYPVFILCILHKHFSIEASYLLPHNVCV